MRKTNTNGQKILFSRSVKYITLLHSPYLLPHVYCIFTTWQIILIQWKNEKYKFYKRNTSNVCEQQMDNTIKVYEKCR